MKLHLLLLLALALTGWSVHAEEADPNELILKIATEKRGAIIYSERSRKDTDNPNTVYGCFIDAEGTAIIGVGVFCRPEKPRFHDMQNEELPAPRLLAIDELNLMAVVKFDHKPETWIEPRKEPLSLMMEPIGILTARGNRPALVGVATARCSANYADSRIQGLRNMLNMAVGAPLGKPVIVVGSPIIDSKGQLCGLFYTQSTQALGRSYVGTPVGELRDLLGRAEKSTEPIAYPLKPDLQPVDPAVKHLGYSKALYASYKNEPAEALDHLKSALKDHPDSQLLKIMHFNMVMMGRYGNLELASDEELLALIKATDPGPDAGKDARALYLFRLANYHRFARQTDEAISLFEKAIELTPEGYWEPHRDLCQIHIDAGNIDKAIDQARKTLIGNPADLPVLKWLAETLAAKRLWDEEAKITEQIYTIERLARPVLR